MVKKTSKKVSIPDGGPRMGSGAPIKEHVLHHLQNGEGSTGGSIIRGIGAGLRDKLSGENITKNLLGGGELAGAFAKRVFAKKVSLAPPDLAPASPEETKVISPKRVGGEPAAKEGTQKRSAGIQGSILKQVTLTNTLLRSIRRQIIAGSGGTVKTVNTTKSPKSVTAKGFDGKSGGGSLFDSITSMLGKFSEGLGGLLPLLGKFALGVTAVTAAFAAGYWLGDKIKDGIDGFIDMVTGGKEKTLGGLLHTIMNDNTPNNKNSQAQTEFMNTAKDMGQGIENAMPSWMNKNKGIEEQQIKNKIAKGDVFSEEEQALVKKNHPDIVIPEDNQPHGPAAPKRVTNEASGAITKLDSPVAKATTPAIPTRSNVDVEKYAVGDLNGAEILNVADTVGISDPAKLSALVKKESGGKFSVKTGDGGKAHGIMQMHQPAIDDVNKQFKTNWTAEQLENNPHLSLLAGARYFKMKGEDFAKYNGGNKKSEMADAYASDANSIVDKINGPSNLAVASAPVPVAPKAPTRGDNIATASAEAQSPTKVASASPASIVNAPSTTVNNNTTINAPLPGVRNRDLNAFALGRNMAYG